MLETLLTQRPGETCRGVACVWHPTPLFGTVPAQVGPMMTTRAPADPIHAFLAKESREGVLVLDSEGRILEANAAFVTRCGRPTDEILGATVDSVLATGETADAFESAHHLLRDHTGHAHPVELRIAELPGGGRVVMVQELTPRRAEADLRERDHSFRETMQAARVAVWEMHQTTGELTVSEVHRELFGLGPNDALPTTIAELRAMVHPDDRGEMIARREGLSATPGDGPVPFEAEYRIITPAGDVRWMRTRGELRRRAADDPGIVRAVTREITTEIKMRFALAESEERFRSAFDTSPIGKVILTTTGETVRVNAALATIVGYDMPTLGTMRWTDLVHPDDRAVMTTNFARLLSGEVPAARAERRLVHRDGSVVDVSITSSALHDATGAVQTAFVLVEDITAAKAMRRAREESEQRLELVLDATRDGIWDWDVATGNAYFGPQWFGMLGYPAEGSWAGPDVFIDLIHPEDRPGVWAANERQIFDPAAPDYDHIFRMRRADGTWAWIRSRGSAVVRDADGRATRIVGTHNNVSAQMEADIARRRSEERFGLVVEALQDGIWDHNLETGRGYISPRYFGMLGYPPRDEASYEDFLQLVHPDDLADVIAANSRQIDDPEAEPYDIELRMLRADGTWARIRARGRVVERAPDGRPLRAIGAHTDVTAQRSLEEQFRQSQKMEAIGKLAGGLAHDFNNLLTAITATTGILLEDLPDADPSRADLEQIARAANRGTTITRQLLAFSRQEVERLQVVGLDEAVAQATPLLHRLLSPGQSLTISGNTHHAAVQIDPAQLELALLNLVANARDAMLAGGVVTLRTRRGTGTAAGMVLLEVADTGTGMDATVRTRLFEPFFTTKPQGEGTGLGLPTVYGFVQRMGGTIQVESTPGKGSCFTLTLPVVTAAETARPAAPRNAIAAPRKVHRILVVDDDDVVRQTTSRLLRRHGYEVLEAPGADAASALLGGAETTVDVVLSDYAMPGRTGEALLREVVARHPAVRGVLMSGFAEDGFVRQAIAGHQIAFLAKPFTLDELVRAVEG